jgi:rare lipoprotein A
MSGPFYADRLGARLCRQKCPEPRTDIGVWFFMAGLFRVVARRAGLLLLAALAALSLAGCGLFSKSTAGGGKGGYYLDDGPGPNPPANLDRIADAVPRKEPYHSGANKPYTVLGKNYVPVVSNERFRQTGIASWYGRKYHGQKTSIGETYDMYAMTAAHPTLPLPCYVRVSNPANGRSVVVRVNDRGPFLSERIIDLSFAAAHRLDLARRGSGQVIVERVFPGDKPAEPIVAAESPPTKSVSVPIAPSLPPPSLPPPDLPPVAAATLASPAEAAPAPISSDRDGGFYLQLGAFSSAENAAIFRTRMNSELDWNHEPISLSNSSGLHRVRLGPYKTRAEAQAIAEQVKVSLKFMPVIFTP